MWCSYLLGFRRRFSLGHGYAFQSCVLVVILVLVLLFKSSP
jgi:hypothetical protein